MSDVTAQMKGSVVNKKYMIYAPVRLRIYWIKQASKEANKLPASSSWCNVQVSVL